MWETAIVVDLEYAKAGGEAVVVEIVVAMRLLAVG